MEKFCLDKSVFTVHIVNVQYDHYANRVNK